MKEHFPHRRHEALWLLKCVYALLLAFMVCQSVPLWAQEVPMLYQKKQDIPGTPYENQLVAHAQISLVRALMLQSKLTGNQFEECYISKKWRSFFIPHYHPLSALPMVFYYHLLNNLCDLPGASHLHVGLLAGDSFIAALYGNQSVLNQQIGVDWFKECPQGFFIANCRPYLDMEHCQVVNNGCFDVDKTIFKAPVDIYFYDADHSLLGHEMAFTYYNDIFSDVFIAVIDDWGCPWIRCATFKAFSKLNYSILYESIIPPTAIDKGQYIAVIRKSV